MGINGVGFYDQISVIEDCTFSWTGCSSPDLTPQRSEERGECQVCAPPPGAKVDHSKEVLILVFVIFLFLFFFFALAMILAFYYYKSVNRILHFCFSNQISRKRLAQRIYEEMEIPDIISDRDNLTLEAILSNTTIPRIKWEDLQVLQVIGKGAAGVVSKGTFNG